MDFDKLVPFIREQWPTIAAVTVIVAPLSWSLTRWLYSNRIEEAAAENRTLRNLAGMPAPGAPVARTGGVAQGEWLSTSQWSGGTYTYRLSLTQNGARVDGTAMITRTGSEGYDQAFLVEGKEFAGCLLLTLTSSSSGSTSAVAALFRIADRGSKLDGHWSYRKRMSDDIAGEPVSLTRQLRT